MPSAWEWWAGHLGEPIYDIGCADTREGVIAAALQSIGPSAQIQIIEARTSTAAKYRFDEDAPFTHTRNHEIIDLRLRPTPGEKP